MTQVNGGQIPTRDDIKNYATQLILGSEHVALSDVDMEQLLDTWIEHIGHTVNITEADFWKLVRHHEKRLTPQPPEALHGRDE